MKKIYWYILLWVWNAAKGEYDTQTENFYTQEEAKAKFDGIRLTVDMPQKGLYKVEDGEDTQLEEWVLTEAGEENVENF